MKKTLNPLTESPKSLVDITKEFMLAYMKSSKATQEDKAWFKKLVNDNKKQIANNLTKTSIDSADWKIVKRAFAERFYPNVLVKASDFFAELENL